MSKTNTKYPTLAQIRKAAGPHVTVWDDDGSECYRATCAHGYCFDQPTEGKYGSGLHELVAAYGAFGSRTRREDRGEAKADLLGRLSGVCSEVAEPCEGHARGDCSWCDGSPE